jgi:hypothetical protein
VLTLWWVKVTLLFSDPLVDSSSSILSQSLPESSQISKVIIMAILSQQINQVEVRIRRHPQNTYFDEYVKVGDREKTDATSCNRYIIPEPGQMYTIELH